MGDYDFRLDLNTHNTMSLINRWIDRETVVLEFGPANGRLTKYLKEEKSCAVTIVEIDAESGREASAFAEQSFIGKKEGNIENYCWMKTSRKYDYIIFADVLEHLSNPKDVLKNCCSVLKEQGKILVSIPNMSHNSILISLFNDEFEYDKTGLLDHSHIHFFTNTSFKKMIKNTDLYIYETEPIYSRVGNNEIKNTYEDIPIEVSTAIRKRKPGSIYQYVYMLGRNAEKKKETIVYEDIDKYEEQESTCFWTTPVSDEICTNNSISRKYPGEEKVTIEFDLEAIEIGNIIRWDPLEHNCCLVVDECYGETKDGDCFELEFIKSNATIKLGRYFCFETEDPMIWYKINRSENGVKKIVFTFNLIKHSFVVDENIKSVLEEIRNNSFTEEYMEKERIRSETIQQLYVDVNHRDKDIAELKSYIDSQNLKMAEMSREIETLTQTLEAYKHPLEHICKKILEDRGK